MVGPRFIFIIVTLVLSASPVVWAQSYRDTVEFSPMEVYQSILNFVDRKEYDKIAGPLKILSPITSHIAEKFKDNPAVAINKAIDKGNQEEILSRVHALIFLDINDLLDEASQIVDQSPGTAKAHVNSARLDYEVLSSYVKKKDFAADQKIKKNFVDSLRALGSESLYSAEKGTLNTQPIKQRWAEIVSSLSKVFTS